MSPLTNLLLLASLGSALVLPRDVSTVLPSLKTIDADTLDFTKSINSFAHGSDPSVLTKKYQKLDLDLSTLASDTNRAQSYTAAQASAICDYANRTLAPDTRAFTSAIIAKKGVLVAEGLRKNISDELAQLQDHTNSVFSGGIIRNSPGGVQAACSEAIGGINGGYNDAQRAYAN